MTKTMRKRAQQKAAKVDRYRLAYRGIILGCQRQAMIAAGTGDRETLRLAHEMEDRTRREMALFEEWAA